jgi:hypothetical protein
VFDTRLAIELVDHMGLEILSVEGFRPYDILVLARKTREANEYVEFPIHGTWRNAAANAVPDRPDAISTTVVASS